MKYLITGGTGSLGQQIIKKLSTDPYNQICLFSRDEQKHFVVKHIFPNCEYILGDIYDRDSIFACVSQFRPDIVIHAAAQKHVLISDENPYRCVKTNVIGTQNVVDASIEFNVEKFCFISTDKAYRPTTLYGSTKFIAERIVTQAALSRKNLIPSTYITGVRYGNVFNSKGSLIPYFLSIAENKNPVFTVTDKDMTRFFLTFSEAIDVIISSLNTLYIDDKKYFRDGIFVVPKLKSIKIIDIAEFFAEKYSGTVKIIGQFEGEKIHEELYNGYCSSDHLMGKDEAIQYLIRNGV